MSEGTEELEVQSGDKRLKLRGSDLLTSVIGMIMCSGLVYLVTLILDHKADAKMNGSEVVMAIREMTKAQQESAKEQRTTNCLIANRGTSTDGMARLAECERIAR